MDSQDFEVIGEHHIRVYTEFLPDRKGIIFVLSERTTEVKVNQKEQAFISMMSHELRTPLASIEGFSEIMIHRQLSAEKQLKYLKTVRGEAQRLGELVTAFLDYQRLSLELPPPTLRYRWRIPELFNLAVKNLSG